MTADDVAAFERALAGGGVGLFPADTVYGLAVDAHSESAVQRLYAIKRRAADKPAAVMFFDLDQALATLADLPPRTSAALRELVPGAVTAIVPNPRRLFPLACGPTPDKIGVRVPLLTGRLTPMKALRTPVIQSSANPAGGPDPRELAAVDAAIRASVDAELDGGVLPGSPSTVVDLTRFEAGGAFDVLREGDVTAREVGTKLHSDKFSPGSGGKHCA